jgi:hypothetical protein
MKLSAAGSQAHSEIPLASIARHTLIALFKRRLARLPRLLGEVLLTTRHGLNIWFREVQSTYEPAALGRSATVNRNQPADGRFVTRKRSSRDDRLGASILLVSHRLVRLAGEAR